MASLVPHIQQDQVRLPAHIVDLAADELRSATGEHIALRPRSFAVLRLLARKAGHLVDRDEIISAVWGDACVTDDSLTQCIADIRKAIGDENRRTLRTKPRRGYLLVPAQRHAETPAHTSERPVIVVIVAASLTGAEGESVATGVATEIANGLARNRDLRVIAVPHRRTLLAEGDRRTNTKPLASPFRR